MVEHDELLHGRRKSFLADVEAVYRTHASEREVQVRMSEDALKLLIKASQEPEQRLLDLYQDLGLHPARAKRAMSEIETGGLGRVHVLARKGRGGSPRGLEVLARGVALLGTHGITPAEKLVSRGGWKHDVYARWIARWAHAQGRSCRFEEKAGQKVFDLLTRDRAGVLVGYEVMLSGSVAWNAEQAAKAVGVAGLAQVVLAGEDLRLLEKIRTQCCGLLDEEDDVGPKAARRSACTKRVNLAVGCADEANGPRLAIVAMGEFSPF